jgi:hypothetical protein
VGRRRAASCSPCSRRWPSCSAASPTAAHRR